MRVWVETKVVWVVGDVGYGAYQVRIYRDFRAWVAGESGGMWILLDVGERITFSNIHLESGSDLLSRAVSSQVPSARGGLTSVFGMGTGGTLQP